MKVYREMAKRKNRKPIARFDRRCQGCAFRVDPDNIGWCYMFEEKPNRLPCAQKNVKAVYFSKREL